MVGGAGHLQADRPGLRDDHPAIALQRSTVAGRSGLHDQVHEGGQRRIAGASKSWCGIFAVGIWANAGVGVKWTLNWSAAHGNLLNDTGVAWRKVWGNSGISPGDIASIAAMQHHFIVTDVGDGAVNLRGWQSGREHHRRIPELEAQHLVHRRVLHLDGLIAAALGGRGAHRGRRASRVPVARPPLHAARGGVIPAAAVAERAPAPPAPPGHRRNLPHPLAAPPAPFHGQGRSPPDRH